MLAGICAGIGEMLDVDPTIIRLAFVFIGIATAIFPLVIAYIIGWIIIPENPEDIAT
jgi:phage shock protein C